MKAKLLLAGIFLFSFSENSVSQEYHPYLENPTWVVSDWVSCCRPPYVRYIAEGLDAQIGEFNYKKFKDPFPMSGADTVYVREDINERKVYRHQDDGDVLIYDFSLEQGDNITLNNIEFVAAVDEIECNDGNRKRIILSSVQQYNGHTLTQTWIEGVGTTAHPFYPARNMYNVMSSGGGTVYTTRCGFQNNEHVYGNPDLCLQYLSNPTTEALERGVTFSPNPFATEFVIASGIDLHDAILRMYNAQGQLVREIKNINGQRMAIQRGDLSTGVYFVQLLQHGELIRTEKIMAD